MQPFDIIPNSIHLISFMDLLFLAQSLLIKELDNGQGN